MHHACSRTSATCRTWFRAYRWPSVGVASALGLLGLRGLFALRGRGEPTPESAAAHAESEIGQRLDEIVNSVRDLKAENVSPILNTLIRTAGTVVESAVIAALNQHMQNRANAQAEATHAGEERAPADEATAPDQPPHSDAPPLDPGPQE